MCSAPRQVTTTTVVAGSEEVAEVADAADVALVGTGAG